MRDKAAAFSNAAEALSQLGIPGILPALRSEDVFVKRFILGGSHSVVTYPPLNALKKYQDHFPLSLHYGERTSLYVHIAFCETMCTFCHYAVKPYRGRAHSAPSRIEGVERYLQALTTEMERWGDKLLRSETVIDSVYIGGGTPLVLDRAQLETLLKTIRSQFIVHPDAPICVEGSPLTITAPDGLEKLQALKEQGVTRLSFGVQSFDDEVLKRAARGYKRETAIHACELATKVFANWNLDLIQSLYKGTPDEVWDNLEVLREVRPPHITWYHGRFANRPQGDWYRNDEKRVSFEGDSETLLGRMLLWEELETAGYHQIDGNRFVRDARYTDPFKKVRTSVTSDLLGIGASSYSHVDFPDNYFREGAFFRNIVDPNDYVAALEAGDDAVATAFHLDEDEYLAASYAIGLRTGRLDAETDRASMEVVKHYAELTTRFHALGLLERFEAEGELGFRLSKLGRLYEDEILSRFYSPYVQKLLGQGGI